MERHPFEDKWQASRERADFVQRFPGLVGAWEDSHGRTVREVAPLPKSGGYVLLLDDGRFIVAPKLEPRTPQMQEAILLLKDRLEARYSDAYDQLERLIRNDRETGRRGRMERILSAVQNNIDEIPELKVELRRLLERLPGP